MEAAGLAFATVAVVQNLIQAYSEAAKLIENVKNFDSDREILVSKIAAEKAIAFSLKTLLFTSSEVPPNATLFDQLDEAIREGLHSIFTRYVEIIRRYLPLNEKYGLSEGFERMKIQAIEADDWGGNGGGVDMKRKLQPIIWGLWDKKKVTKFVEEAEIQNKKITQFIELHVLRRQISALGGRPPLQLPSMSDTEDLGIQDALVAQAKALELPLNEGFPKVEDFEQDWMKLGNSRNLKANGSFEMGQFNDCRVILDSKLYDGHPSKEEKDNAKARLNQLTSILTNLHRLEAGIPECLGWIHRLDRSAYSLLFKIPKSLEPQPQPLYDALPNTSTSCGPLLDERLELAYQLASALGRLHSVSWIHKNIRSENIFFYYTKSSVNKAEEPPPGKMLPPKWFLYGFEYARTMDAETSNKMDTDPVRNIYRHPQRWGVPTVTFDAVHDIYALGVVLLELGLWRKAESFIKVAGARPDPFRVRNALIERATNFLGYMMGTAYRDIVIRCLKSDFGTEPDGSHESRMELASNFRSLVVDELEVLVFPYSKVF